MIKNYPKYIIDPTVKMSYSKQFPTALHEKHFYNYFKDIKIHKISAKSGRIKIHTPSISHFQYDGTDDPSPIVLLCEVANRMTHCVLVKEGDRVTKFTIETEFDTSPLQVATDSESVCIADNKFVNPHNSAIVYDMECVNRLDNDHVPIIITACEIYFNEMSFDNDIFNISKCKEIEYDDCVIFKGCNCIDEFFKWLGTRKSTQIFAHNGSRYDNCLLLKNKTMLVVDNINVGTSYKSLTLRIDDRDYVFKDSMCFVTMSLKNMNTACGNKKFFKADAGKEIENVTPFSIFNKQFCEYAKLDTLSLGESLQNFENEMRKFGVSITTSVTLPSMSEKIWKNMTPGYKNIFLPTSRKTKAFIEDGMYAGRVIHNYANEITEEMVCLDVNSEYPAAMMNYLYPVGDVYVLKDHEIAAFTRHFEIMIERFPFCMLEVTMNAGNIRYPQVPWRMKKNGLLLYPANEFRGVYTSVDITEALNFGYKIVEVHQGIYWKNSSYIYRDYINTFYEIRKKYKAENNPMESVMKLIMNSLYGKMLQKIDTSVSFSKRIPVGVVMSEGDLPNGQHYFRKRIFPRDTLPKYLGIFILSYARRILNQIYSILDPSDVYYSDTDSVYISKKNYERVLREKPDLIGNELGQFKNDYGEGCVIKSALFADIKRYYLTFNTKVEGTDIDKFKCKFQGLIDRKTNALQITKDLFMKMALHDEVLTIPQQKWFRNIRGSIKICLKELKFTVNRNARRTWCDDGTSFPPNYEQEIAERIQKYEDKMIMVNPIGNRLSRSYYINRYGEMEVSPQLDLSKWYHPNVNLCMTEDRRTKFKFLKKGVDIEIMGEFGSIFSSSLTAKSLTKPGECVHVYKVLEEMDLHEIQTTTVSIEQSLAFQLFNLEMYYRYPVLYKDYRSEFWDIGTAFEILDELKAQKDPSEKEKSDLNTLNAVVKYYVENGRVRVQYRHARTGLPGNGGRFYNYIGGKSAGYQNLSRPVRKRLCEDYFVDIDMVNSHPSIIMTIAILYSDYFDVEFTALKEIVYNRKEVLKRYKKKQIICRMFNPKSKYIHESAGDLMTMHEEEEDLLERFDIEIQYIIETLIDNVDYFKEQVDLRESTRHWFQAFVTSIENQLLSMAVKRRNFPIIFDGFLYPLADLDKDRGELSREFFISKLSRSVRKEYCNQYNIDRKIPIEFIIKSWD
jgi:hypothetical protein